MTEASNIIYPSGLIGDVSLTAGLPATGVSMNPPLITTPLPGVALTGLGTGRYPSSALALNQGTIDLYYTTGATGSARSLLIIADSLSAPVGYLEISLDTNNKVTVVHKDAYGTTVSAVTGGFSNAATGTSFHVRYAWSAVQAVNGSRFASLTQNGVQVAAWATSPQSAWVPFLPAGMAVAVNGLVTSASFNGKIQKVQVGNIAVL